MLQPRTDVEGLPPPPLRPLIYGSLTQQFLRVAIAPALVRILVPLRSKSDHTGGFLLAWHTLDFRMPPSKRSVGFSLRPLAGDILYSFENLPPFTRYI